MCICIKAIPNHSKKRKSETYVCFCVKRKENKVKPPIHDLKKRVKKNICSNFSNDLHSESFVDCRKSQNDQKDYHISTQFSVRYKARMHNSRWLTFLLSNHFALHTQNIFVAIYHNRPCISFFEMCVGRHKPPS